MEISREDHRILIEERGQLLAEFTSPFVDKQTVDIDCTFPDAFLRGQGVRGALIKETTAVIRKKCQKCMAFNPCALAWMKKHEKEQDIWMEEEPRRGWLVYISMHCIFVMR